MNTIFVKLLNNKLYFYLISAAITALVFGMLFTRFSNKDRISRVQKISLPTPTQTTDTLDKQAQNTSVSGKATNENKIVDSLASMKESSSKEVVKILPKLPIYLRGYNTSSGIKTTINIFSVKGDASNYIRVEIYGINYNNSEAVEENKDYIAFKESFIKAKEEIRKAGADPDKLIYVFYTRENIHTVAENWARKLELINY